MDTNMIKEEYLAQRRVIREHEGARHGVPSTAFFMKQEWADVESLLYKLSTIIFDSDGVLSVELYRKVYALY